MDISLRTATIEDLEDINHVIETAVMTWKLPERVKRLSLSSYRYTALDFEHLVIWVAVNEAQKILGIGAWEEADPRETPQGVKALLLHGLYVAPAQQHQGIGGQLFQAVMQAAREQDYAGLLVRAQEQACGFFEAMGMRRLAVNDPARHYANRFWLPA